MDDQTKKDFIQLFNQGFEEVILPVIEDFREELSGRLDKVENKLETVENRLETVENRLEMLDRKVDRIADNQLDLQAEVSNHKKSIKQLEDKRLAA